MKTETSYVVAKGYILATVRGFAHGGESVAPTDFSSPSEFTAALKLGCVQVGEA